jgi:hypothetical protein
MNLRFLLLSLAFACGAGTATAAVSSSVKSALADIARAGPEGQGNAAAGAAWEKLAKAEASAIPAILAAMDDANELAANYLRSAVDAIADRELNAGRKLPQADIEKFLADTKHNPRARRLAYELIARISPPTAAKLLPGFVNDPSVELRRDAVEQLIAKADAALAAKDNATATKEFQNALVFARDETQIRKIAGELRKLGQTVDLPRHFGFLTHWKVIGPFDNTRLVGFDTAYPPEKEINLAAEYDGKAGRVKWTDAATGHDYGMLDVNRICGDDKGVTAYAFTEYESPKAQTVELRLGSKNGWKIWVNGEFVFGRDEYHRGARIDQYRLPVKLRAGRNTILVKLCQNEEVKDWTKEWEFQLRVCDASGTAILASNRQPTPDPTANATKREQKK